MKNRIYAAIDLKSFYASAECQERGLDPLHVNLVVADEERTDRTICLAVTPALKSFGIPGRPRLFEVNEAVKKINKKRREAIGMQAFRGISAVKEELENDPYLEFGFHIARPRMALYITYSTRIYEIYLRYISAQDIHVYSIDEVFIDLTDYLKVYGMNAHELTRFLIRQVLQETGITATAGIGSNLFLAKVAMDIEAKHMQADKDGVRIAELDEITYRQKLWDHQPLTDFWRIGPGIAAKLEKYGLDTMGKLASYALRSDGEDFLFKLFGVNAELIIDHAWGREPCTIEDIQTYEPSSSSLGAGQVLAAPYEKKKAVVVLREMCDQLALDLTEKKLVTDSLMLSVGYQMNDDHSADWYGKRMPAGVHGSVRLERRTSSQTLIRNAVLQLYERIVSPLYMVRRLSITACNTEDEAKEGILHPHEQLDLFSDPNINQEREQKLEEELAKEKNMQKAILKLRKKYGKNSVLKGTDYEEGATGKERNEQIGGHRA